MGVRYRGARIPLCAVCLGASLLLLLRMPAVLHAAGDATVQVVAHPSYGPILADATGRSLYLFTVDGEGTSACYDACAELWPPVLVSGQPQAGEGIDAALLGTTRRTDGSLQATYGGWPLYYYALDQAPGATAGQGVGGVWFLVSPQGERVEASPTAGPTDTAGAPETPGPAEEEGSLDEAALAQLLSEGRTLYSRVCARCHGAQGQGGRGVALRNNDRLQDAAFVVQAITRGLGYMPPVAARFSDREVAAVVSFVRSAFGNEYGPVEEGDVADLR